MLTRIDLSPGWWVVLAVFCLLPLLWTLAVALLPQSEPEPAVAA